MAVLLAQHEEHRGADVSAPHPAPAPTAAAATGSPAEATPATPAAGEVPAVTFVALVAVLALVALGTESAPPLAACPAALVSFVHHGVLHNDFLRHIVAHPDQVRS